MAIPTPVVRRLAGGVVGLVAALHAPGWVLSSTETGRRLACAYLRGEYLAFTQRMGFSPTVIQVGRKLFNTFLDEVLAHERRIQQLPLAQQLSAPWLPDEFFFKGSVVREYGDGWRIRLR